MRPVEGRLERRKRALGARPLDAAVLDAMAVLAVFEASVAHAAFAVEHEIAWADGHVVVRRVEDGHMMLL